MSKIRMGLMLFSFIVLAFVGYFVQRVNPSPGTTALASSADPQSDGYFYSQIQPLLTNRCVSCHGCYSSPCQLNFQSVEGVGRGAHAAPDIYDPSRFSPVPTTRLGMDAHSPTEWQTKFGFFNVMQNQVMSAMLGAGPANLSPADPQLLNLPRPEDEKRVCPRNSSELETYYQKYPAGRMPYGLPGLTDDQKQTLGTWMTASEDAPHVPNQQDNSYRNLNSNFGQTRQTSGYPLLGAGVRSGLDNEVTKWNHFFNYDLGGGDAIERARHKLVSRYIFEHMFLAHIYFDQEPNFFFRMARSSTPCGAQMSEVITRKPSDPRPDGVDEFYYCLIPLNQVVVEKNHMPVHFDDHRMNRWIYLFFNANDRWVFKNPPAQDVKVSSNPFWTFQDIPAHARYQFLLDDAMYMVSTFIKGPVCYGNGAINSIQDQFYVLFTRPESDVLARPSKDPHMSNVPFYNQNTIHMLELPGKWATNTRHAPKSFWGHVFEVIGEITGGISRAIKLNDKAMDFEIARMNEMNVGYGVNDIWDGKDSYQSEQQDPPNDNALLTVFRHSESAYVLKGARGDLSKTVWVLDYSLFERLVYNLVVNYDVFDNIELQALTRMYMGLIRLDSEALFLSYLPKAIREPLRESWYKGHDLGLLFKESTSFVGLSRQAEPQPMNYSPMAQGTPEITKKEFIENLFQGRLKDIVARHPDPLNWKMYQPILNPAPATDLNFIEQQLRPLTGRTVGDQFPNAFPDLAFLQIVGPDGGTAAVYSIVRNKELMAPMMISTPILSATENSLTIEKNLAGSFPNLFFRVQEDDVGTWVACIQSIRPSMSSPRKPGEEARDWSQLLRCNGVQRNDPHFWDFYDQIQASLAKEIKNEMGVIDLSRYGYSDSIEVH